MLLRMVMFPDVGTFPSGQVAGSLQRLHAVMLSGSGGEKSAVLLKSVPNGLSKVPWPLTVSKQEIEQKAKIQKRRSMLVLQCVMRRL